MLFAVKLRQCGSAGVFEAGYMLLYTDFPRKKTAKIDVFLQNADFAEALTSTVFCIPLPLDCAGKRKFALSPTWPS